MAGKDARVEVSWATAKASMQEKGNEPSKAGREGKERWARKKKNGPKEKEIWPKGLSKID